MEQDPIVQQTGKNLLSLYLDIIVGEIRNPTVIFSFGYIKLIKNVRGSITWFFLFSVAAIIELSRYKLSTIANALGTVLENVSKVRMNKEINKN